MDHPSRCTSYLPAAVALLALASTGCAARAAKPADRPVRALLITGGCCHDYTLQANALTEGTKRLGAIEWTVVNEGGTGTKAQLPLYDDPSWAKPYDVVVHNECFADTTEPGYIRKITAGHKAGVPAVVVHCAMHTYRAAEVDDWRELLGVTSRRHDHQAEYPVTLLAAGHPAFKGFPASWTTPKDELYILEKVWPGATPLATSKSEKDGSTHAVAWTHDYHGTRVFGTTLGHSTGTWQDPVFVTMVSRAVFWAAGRDLP